MTKLWKAVVNILMVGDGWHYPDVKKLTYTVAIIGFVVAVLLLALLVLTIDQNILR